MNWMEFVSSLVKSIIWPIAIIIIVIKLKKPVSNLISTLAKIKYKDWEFEFMLDKRLDEIASLADNSNGDPIETKPEDKSTSKEIKERTPLTGFIESTQGAGKTSPIVYLLRRELTVLDQIIRDLYQTTKSKEGKIAHNVSVNEMIRYLISNEIISDQMGESLRLIRQTPYEFETMKVIPEFLIDKYRQNIKNLSLYLTSLYERINSNESSE